MVHDGTGTSVLSGHAVSPSKHEHIGAMSLGERQQTFPVHVATGLSPADGSAALQLHVSPKALR